MNSAPPFSTTPPEPELPAPWPYPWYSYPLRLLWWIVWMTLWKVCWHRIPILRVGLLRLFGARTSRKVRILGSVRIELPWSLTLGEYISIGPRVHLYNLGGIRIGDRASISQDAYLCGGTHDYTTLAYPLIRKPIIIGRYAWIAAGAFIGPGVTIGEGAVVGARAVVMKDVEPWTVVAGNPAKVIKKRELSHPLPESS